MKLEKIKVLSNDEIQTIHSASMELLSSVGIKVDAKDARDLFENRGAEVDNATNFVKIPESLIKEQLKTVPNSFKLYGPDGSFNFEVNTISTKFATIGTPVKLYDSSHPKELRKVIFKDNIKQIRIVDSLEHIMCSHVDIWPSDIPYLELHCHCIREWARHSFKPYGLGCLGKVASQDMMNLLMIIVGS